MSLTHVYQFLQLTEDVARKKAEYQKHLDYYKQLRMRFEEHYIKCKSVVVIPRSN